MVRPLQRPDGPIRVLIINDSAPMLVAIVERLGIEGVATVEAQTYEGAVTAFSTHRSTIEVVLVDCFFRRDGGPEEGNFKDSESGVIFARWLYGEAGFTGKLVASCSRLHLREQLVEIAGATRCTILRLGDSDARGALEALKPQQGR